MKGGTIHPSSFILDQMSKRHQTTDSNTYRFFVPADSFRGEKVSIKDAELVHQLGSVLRLRVGDQIVLLDNAGWQYTTLIERIERGGVLGAVQSKDVAGGEPNTQLTLYLALLRPERFEWALQKGTELGITTFVPFTSEHSIVDAASMSERKMLRWNKILREAAEQSRRGKIPSLLPLQRFADACQHVKSNNLGLFLWEGGGAQPLRQVLSNVEVTNPRSIGVLSGPEGGFTEKELETARDYGIIAVTLGPRTLRAETAPLAAATAIFYELGDLDNPAPQAH